MSKIRSIEDYFVTKFNEAQEEIRIRIREKLSELGKQLSKIKMSSITVLRNDVKKTYGT